MNDETKLATSAPTERLDDQSEPLEVGQWYWVKHDKEKFISCITHVGSNYAALKSAGPNSWRFRILFDDFDKKCTREPAHEAYIAAQISSHQQTVGVLMEKIKQVTALLGVAPRDALADKAEGQSQALAVAHGTADVKAHKQALILAKEKTLPELFKEIEKEHAALADWMKASLIPMQANLESMNTSIEVIDDRIMTVELYAGLTEDLEQIREGNPAPNDTKVSLFQRRHYMDEECLVNYEAGGMEFADIRAFDAWLTKPENLNRILPLDRCIVAFRVRRLDKKRNGSSLEDFIHIAGMRDLDKRTFLYIRNGEQVFRMGTAIDFGEQLFPDQDRSTMLGGGNLYIDTKWTHKIEVIGQREYDAYMADWQKELDDYKKLKARYEALSPKEKKDSFRILGGHVWQPLPRKEYVPCTPGSVYYDDAMKEISRTAMEHNRIAVVLQGLLDRSVAFHPHPPWRIWTPEGFTAGIELIYDDAKALTVGNAPDFEEYFAGLNKLIKRGTMTIGQEDFWLRAEAKKENDRADRSWRRSRDREREHFKPYGNPGPGHIAEVAKMGRKGECTFEWTRDRQGVKWIRDPANPGYMKEDDSEINTHITCPRELLFNVSDYKPGDYKQFFADPRTRADYLKWAPLLLRAENWHAKHKK